MTHDHLRLFTVLACIAGLAVVTGAHLAGHPDAETLIALVAAWAGGVLVCRLGHDGWGIR